MERTVNALLLAELRPPGTLQQLGRLGQLIEVVVSGARGTHMCVELGWATGWTCGVSMTVLPAMASVALWDATP